MFFESLGIFITIVAVLAIVLYSGNYIEKTIKERAKRKNREEIENLVEEIRKEYPMPDYVHIDDFLSNPKWLLQQDRATQMERLIEQTNIYYRRLSRAEKNGFDVGYKCEAEKKYEQEKEHKDIRYSLSFDKTTKSTPPEKSVIHSQQYSKLISLAIVFILFCLFSFSACASSNVRQEESLTHLNYHNYIHLSVSLDDYYYGEFEGVNYTTATINIKTNRKDDLLFRGCQLSFEVSLPIEWIGNGNSIRESHTILISYEGDGEINLPIMNALSTTFFTSLPSKDEIVITVSGASGTILI